MKKFVLVITIFIATFGYGEIHVINRFSESKPYLEDLNSSTLVIFDVDGVISVPTNTYLTSRNFTYYWDFCSSFIDSLSKKEKDYYIGLLAMHSEERLVDKSIPEFIKKIQSSNAKVIALTSIPSGKIDYIENMNIWRQKQLLFHGIDFSTSFEEEKLILFKEFLENLNSYPSYYKGVITVNGIHEPNKGSVLISFLQKLEYIPQKVIFFDDNLINLELVDAALSDVFPSVEFIGFHYNGVHFIKNSTNLEDLEGFLSKVKQITEQAKKSV